MHYRLRIARRRPQGGVDIETLPLEAGSTGAAASVANLLTDTALAGEAGVATLVNADGTLVWSQRSNLPKPDGPGFR